MLRAQPCQHAVDVFAGRLEDKQIHYGLVFALPAGKSSADCGQARKCSDADTHSRHGTVEDWYLGTVGSEPTRAGAVLLIPRTWLIRQGFLSPWVLFLPYRRFALRRADALQSRFWLEWPAPARDTAEQPLLHAA